VNEGSTYATTDFYLASFLKAIGLRLLETDRQGRRVTFIFEDRPDRKGLVQVFYNDGEVKVNAFVHAIQDLKAVLYNW